LPFLPEPDQSRTALVRPDATVASLVSLQRSAKSTLWLKAVEFDAQ
jgi:hypothetical protein